MLFKNDDPYLEDLNCFETATLRSAYVSHQPGEPKNRGHVTITHQMLASTGRAFCTRSLLRSNQGSAAGEVQ